MPRFQLYRFLAVLAVPGFLLVAGCQPKSESSGDAATTTSLPTGLKVGDAAPNWTLKDLDGNEVSSTQFAGKVVVIDFWATWCQPCREEIPGYVAMQKKYGPDGLAFIGVSLDTAPVSEVKAFAKQYQMNYPVLLGDKEIISAFGGVEYIPTTYLIDRDGVIRDGKVGKADSAAYEKKIQAVLN